MNPQHLRTFLCVRKHLSYTRAAEEIFLSQPAVSRQIHQLEQELGIALFEQIGKSLHLTDAGATMVVEAEKILGDIERAGEAVRAHHSAARGVLRIGASSTPGLYLLPPLLGRFHERFPDVELRYVVENSHRIEHRIVRNELDLGFVGLRLSNGDLDMETLIEDEIVCFASSSSALAKRRRLAPRSLEAQIWVVRERGSATRQLFESWLGARGSALGRTIELESPEATKALVAAGVGLSFMSVHGLRDELRSGRLKKLRVSGLDLRRRLFLVRHREKRLSAVGDAFLSIVRRALAREMTRVRSAEV